CALFLSIVVPPFLVLPFRVIRTTSGRGIRGQASTRNVTSVGPMRHPNPPRRGLCDRRVDQSPFAPLGPVGGPGRSRTATNTGSPRFSTPGADQRSSIRPSRQISSAIPQVAANMTTITNPRKLKSAFSNQLQNGPERSSREPTRPPSSIVPITNATATDRPVIVRLKNTLRTGLESAQP